MVEAEIGVVWSRQRKPRFSGHQELEEVWEEFSPRPHNHPLDPRWGPTRPHDHPLDPQMGALLAP